MHLFAGFTSEEEGSPQENGGVPALGRQPWVSLGKDELFLGSWCHRGAHPSPIQLAFSRSILQEKPVLRLWLPLQSRGAGAAAPPAHRSAQNLGAEALCSSWGFLGEGQGTPGVLPEGHTQPRLRGHAAGGEAEILGLELELAVGTGQRLLRLCLPGGKSTGASGNLSGTTGPLSQCGGRAGMDCEQGGLFLMIQFPAEHSGAGQERSCTLSASTMTRQSGAIPGPICIYSLIKCVLFVGL